MLHKFWKHSFLLLMLLVILILLFPMLYRWYLTSKMLSSLELKYYQKFKVTDQHVFRNDLLMGRLPDRWTLQQPSDDGFTFTVTSENGVQTDTYMAHQYGTDYIKELVNTYPELNTNTALYCYIEEDTLNLYITRGVDAYSDDLLTEPWLIALLRDIAEQFEAYELNISYGDRTYSSYMQEYHSLYALRALSYQEGEGERYAKFVCTHKYDPKLYIYDEDNFPIRTDILPPME